MCTAHVRKSGAKNAGDSFIFQERVVERACLLSDRLLRQVSTRRVKKGTSRLCVPMIEITIGAIIRDGASSANKMPLRASYKEPKVQSAFATLELFAASGGARVARAPKYYPAQRYFKGIEVALQRCNYSSDGDPG